MPHQVAIPLQVMGRMGNAPACRHATWGRMGNGPLGRWRDAGIKGAGGAGIGAGAIWAMGQCPFKSRRNFCHSVTITLLFDLAND